MHLLLPLAASLLYVFATLFLKQAAGQRIGVWRTVFVSNWAAAIIILLLVPTLGELPTVDLLWQPFLVAVFFLSGQVLALLALEIGDVSVATPVLGIKIVLVAVFSVLISDSEIAPTLWLGAILATSGIVLMNRKGSSGGQKTLPTVFCAAAAAASYALFDVLLMHFSKDWVSRGWSAGWVLIIAMWMSALLSLLMIPRFSQPLQKLPHLALRPLFIGALLLALQNLLVTLALSFFGDATAVNIVYSLRGLWSIAAVWLIGHWFANTERELGREVLLNRVAGAGLLSAAVILIFV